MKKREVRKEVYQLIVKEGKSHQETFDELRESTGMNAEALAAEVSKVPSPARQDHHKALVFVYVGLLCLVILLRTLSIFTLSWTEGVQVKFLFLMVLVGVILPLSGIWGALTARSEMYQVVGVFLAISVFRGFTQGQFPLEALDILLLIPFVAVIILSFYIPYKLKTPYQKMIRKMEADGMVTTKIEYVFDSSLPRKQSGLIDDI